MIWPWERAMNHSEIVNFPWGVAALIRGSFKRGEHREQNAISRKKP